MTSSGGTRNRWETRPRRTQDFFREMSLGNSRAGHGRDGWSPAASSRLERELASRLGAAATCCTGSPADPRNSRCRRSSPRDRDVLARQRPVEGRITIPVQLQLEASQLSVDEILVARSAMDGADMEGVRRNRDEFDLDEMQALLKVAAKAEAGNDVDSFVKADLGFHELLGQCTHNQLLQEVQIQITRSTAAVRGIASTTHDAMGAALRYHAEIRDSVRSRRRTGC